MGIEMKVSRWGNSLAVRLPVELVRKLGLKEGDLVGADRLALYKVHPPRTREEALEVMRNARWKLPEGYKFDREEANAR
jgi:antitoxin MazE